MGDNVVNRCKEGKNIKEQLEFLRKMLQEVRSLNALSTIDIFGTLHYQAFGLVSI